MARYLDFSLDQGATLSQKVNYQNSNKSNLSLSGFDVRAQMRRSQYSANAVSITATVSDAVNGEVTLSLAANVTAALRPGRWFYDVEANTTNDATVIRIVEGIISVMPGVTGTVATIVPTGTTTSSIPEGTNLYFTNARVWANISPRIAELTTSNIAEGANLYFTNARVWANVEPRIAELTTSNIAEGSNLYFTNARAYAGIFDNSGNLILLANGAINYANGVSILSGLGAGANTGNITFDDSNILSTTNSIRLIANSSGDAKTWEFYTDAALSLPGNLLFSGCTISAINSISNSSSDGLGAATLEIVPDTALVNNDQYIVIDPTEPDHIHIRGGGAIDNCSAKLIFGGEHSHFAVQAGANSSVGVRANGYNWTFNTDGTLSAQGSISSDGIISTGKVKFDRIIESFSEVYNPTGAVTFDCFISHVFDVTSINSNFTANLTNFELSDGEATAVTLVLNQGANAYIANALHFSGVAQTIKWQGNTVPVGNVNAIDIQTFSVIRANGVYKILGQLTTFG